MPAALRDQRPWEAGIDQEILVGACGVRVRTVGARRRRAPAQKRSRP